LYRQFKKPIARFERLRLTLNNSRVYVAMGEFPSVLQFRLIDSGLDLSGLAAAAESCNRHFKEMSRAPTLR
jgi:hypothetical protein